ncbi:potassium/sodium hyperpolarization-activated cyclic nucleotide-gated channel 4 [Clonorchis sinensis]|uniref:Potassium/sodium hyperpolarization-activated cyclic nucleotide-gated channel 4 n=1 Tax=Clonorchis sinensis TaxID=79923 RepID=G7YAJ3_CLOSI|nr:potassium/sodium hyperpolarization-activated cyclic nucleotide-gated channel 4 [Clonorchis sinensis]
MLLLLIANLIILPVAISFFNEELTIHWIAFNCISDTVFLVDIGVNFRTGIIKNNFADEIVLNPKEIARHYVKTWFLLDLLSSLPLDYIYLIFHENENFSHIVQAGRALRFLRFAKLLSLIKLLRLSRLVRYVSQWEEFLNVANKFIGIFNLVLLLLLLGHWNACLQFLVPMINDYPVDSWVSKVKLQNANWFEQYTWALFKAMSHMLSIGYGRYPPTSITEAWITLVSMVTGATGYALFVGHAAALIQSFDCSKRLYREKFKQVDEYMAFRKLPRALRQRIASYYEHRYQGKMFNENEILNELSECLKEQIINYNCRALVAAVPFFTFADQNFVSEVIIKLRYEVFQPGDLIIKEGTIGSKMYFIQEGIVDIVTRDGEIATSLSDGSYFGEICLLTNARRVASVRAETYCNVYSLDRASFLEVLDNYPLMRRTMESVAAERLNKIGRDPLVVSKRKDLYDDLKLVNEIVNQIFRHYQNRSRIFVYLFINCLERTLFDGRPAKGCTIAEASDTEAEAPVCEVKRHRRKCRARLRKSHHCRLSNKQPRLFSGRRKSVLRSIKRAIQHFQPKIQQPEMCNSASPKSSPEKKDIESSDGPPEGTITPSSGSSPQLNCFQQRKHDGS